MEDVLAGGAVEREAKGEVHVEALKVGVEHAEPVVDDGGEPGENRGGDERDVGDGDEVDADAHRLDVDGGDSAGVGEPQLGEAVGEVVGVVDAGGREEVEVGPLVVGVDPAAGGPQGVVDGLPAVQDEPPLPDERPHDVEGAVDGGPVGVAAGGGRGVRVDVDIYYRGVPHSE